MADVADSTGRDVFSGRNIFDHYKVPTLRSILDEYYTTDSAGDNSDTNSQTNPQKRRKKKSNKSASGSRNDGMKKGMFFEEALLIEEPRIILERRKNKDQRLLKTMSDDEQERYLYYLTYRETQIKKEEMRRIEAKKRHDNDLARAKQIEEDQIRKSHRYEKRLERVTLHHDSEYLKSIPKSDIYKAVKMEKDLVKKGKLRYQNDRDFFWTQVKRYHGNLTAVQRELIKRDMGALGNNLEEMDSDRPESIELTRRKLGEQQRIVDAISEVDEASRPVTQRTITRGRVSAKRLAAMFPKAEAPILKCFDMDLSEKRLCKEEEIRLSELQNRCLRRRKRKELKQQMFDIAQAHTAAAKRILEDQVEDMPSVDFTSLADFTCAAPRSSTAPRTDPPRAILPPPGAQLSYQHPTGKSKYRMIKAESLDEFRATLHTSNQSERSVSQPAALDEDRPTRHVTSFSNNGTLPLTMDELSESMGNMRTAQKPSVYWTNYLQCGNARFSDGNIDSLDSPIRYSEHVTSPELPA